MVCPFTAARAVATTRQQHAHQILIAKPPKSCKPQSPFPWRTGGFCSPCGLLVLCHWLLGDMLDVRFWFCHEDVAMTLNIDENKSNFRQPGIRRIR